MKNLANFLFEVGMLKRTPRSGHQFLGSGSESVAEHICRVIFIGYALAKLDGGADETKLLKMCFLHDLHEARTGDMNYMNKKYVSVDEDKALRDLCDTLPFGDEILQVTGEFNSLQTREALLAYDADQIELILMLKEQRDLGNKYADEWISFALKRLKTDAGKGLAREVIETDWTLWWFKDKSDWWVSAGNPRLTDDAE
jgi:putative hydrolase of HD superfamily